MFTHDIPKTFNTFLGSYADDTLISAFHYDPQTVSQMIQNHLNMIELWANRWKIQINETKSTHVTFSLRNLDCSSVMFNHKIIPPAKEVKYLGLTFDKRLTWSAHLKQKRKSVNSRLHLCTSLRPLLKSKLSLTNKILIYKSIIRSAWLYGIQLWGSAKPSNFKTIQSFQLICLRIMTSAPWYVSNKNLYKDLNLLTLNDLA